MKKVLIYIILLSCIILTACKDTEQQAPLVTSPAEETLTQESLDTESMAADHALRWEVSEEGENLIFKELANNNTLTFQIPRQGQNIHFSESEKFAIVTYFVDGAGRRLTVINLEENSRLDYSIFNDPAFNEQLNSATTYNEIFCKWITDNRFTIEFGYTDEDNKSYVGRYHLDASSESASDLMIWESDAQFWSEEQLIYDSKNTDFENPELLLPENKGNSAWNNLGSRFGLISESDEALQLYAYMNPLYDTGRSQFCVVRYQDIITYFPWETDLLSSEHQIIASDIDNDEHDEIICINQISSSPGIQNDELHILEVTDTGGLEQLAALSGFVAEELINERIDINFNSDTRELSIQIDGDLYFTTEINEEFAKVKLDNIALGGLWNFQYHDNQLQLYIGNPYLDFEDGTVLGLGQFIIDVSYDNEGIEFGEINFIPDSNLTH